MNYCPSKGLRYVTQEINMQNHKRYRSDIETKDKKERHRISDKEYSIKSGRFKGTIRPKGTGGISLRENETWRAIIKKDGIKHDKTFTPFLI